MDESTARNEIFMLVWNSGCWKVLYSVMSAMDPLFQSLLVITGGLSRRVQIIECILDSHRTVQNLILQAIARIFLD